jgi:hypothetical protein
MSENPQVKAILEHIETRERELADQSGQFRARIEELTRQLSELDAESENLRITRKTLLTLPLPSPATGPDHPAYQQILTALADAGRPMRARDLCLVSAYGLWCRGAYGLICRGKPACRGGVWRAERSLALTV